jgi:hypothetical protein
MNNGTLAKFSGLPFFLCAAPGKHKGCQMMSGGKIQSSLLPAFLLA